MGMLLGSIASGYTVDPNAPPEPWDHRREMRAPREKRPRPEVPVVPFASESERLEAIAVQLKFYFQSENFYFDRNLQHMSEKREGFVPIPAILGFKKMVSFAATVRDILRIFEIDESVQKLLELTPQFDHAVRRRVPDSEEEWLATQKKILFVPGVPIVDATDLEVTRTRLKIRFDNILHEISAAFLGNVSCVRLFPPADGRMLTNANVAFSTREAAEQVLKWAKSPKGEYGYKGFVGAEQTILKPEPVDDSRGTLWRPHNAWAFKRPAFSGRGRDGKGRGRGAGGGFRGDRDRFIRSGDFGRGGRGGDFSPPRRGNDDWNRRGGGHSGGGFSRGPPPHYRDQYHDGAKRGRF